MKILNTIACLPLIISSFLVSAQTQDDETKEAIKSLKITEAELVNVYNKIRVLYKDQSSFIKNLEESQDLWIKFRDAELKMKFPEGGEYGSVYAMCVNDYLTELTRERITKLQEWLKGTYEGDVCSGSVKIN